MEKRLKDYLSLMEQMKIESFTEEQRLQKAQELLIQIGFFQHERLIHLIVTITFALLTMMSVMGSLALVPGLLLLTVLLVVLLAPYIRHYYILENGVQKLYGYYDRLVEGLV